MQLKKNFFVDRESCTDNYEYRVVIDGQAVVAQVRINPRIGDSYRGMGLREVEVRLRRMIMDEIELRIFGSR